mgnify:CR=1 FL=1
MKTKQLMNLALISGLLLTAGCWDDQNTGTAENNDPVELRISPRVTLTRGVVDGARSLMVLLWRYMLREQIIRVIK